MTSAASDQVYCFKCRSKTDTLEAQEVVLKNGRHRRHRPMHRLRDQEVPHGCGQEVTGGSERLCCAAVACNPGQAGWATRAG